MSDVISVPTELDVVRVEGPDALTYLQSQLAQDLLPVAVGGAVASLLLQPTGKIEAVVRVRRVADDAYELDVDPGFGDAVVARLRRFKIRVAAEISLERRSIVAIRGAGAEHAAAAAGVETVPAWWGDGDAVDALPGAVVGRPATEAELHAARVAAGWPAMGVEITPGETMPAESGITSVAVSFTKGCYPGQELVERMDSRGAAPPRSLRRLQVADGARAGDAIVHEGVEVGTITSVAGAAALGYVKRGVEVGEPLR